VEAIKHLTYPPLVQVRPLESMKKPPLEAVKIPEKTAN
jgi:hypothetical protein